MSTINYTQSIFLQEALQAFVATLQPLTAFSRSYSGATSQKGSAIIVPRVEALTATTFNYTNNSSRPYEAGGGTINSITVNLNNHRYVTSDITDIQAANQSPAILVNFARQQAKSLAKLVLQDLFANFTTVNYGAAVLSTTVANVSLAGIRTGRTAVIKRDAMPENLILNADSYASLLSDANMTQAFQYGGSEGVREARLPRVLGMNTFETNVLPTNSISLVGMIVHPDSLAVAVRTLQPQRPEVYSRFEILTDDETGLSMGYREYFEPATGKLYCAMECLFGSAVGLSLGAGLIVRTD